MNFITHTEPYVAFGSPVCVIVAGFIKKDTDLRWKGYDMAVSNVTAGLLTTVLKYSFNRPRPFVTYPDINKYTLAGSKSFPSGHTASAFAAATSLSLSFPKWYVIAPAYAYACTIGYSRMYLGVHYPSDVFMGALVGSGTAVGMHYVMKGIKKRITKKKQPVIFGAMPQESLYF